MGRQYIHWSRQGLQHLDMAFMLLNVVAPILDRTYGRHRVTYFEQRIEWVSLAAGERVLKEDDRQVGCIGDKPEMLQRYFGTRLSAETEWVWGKHQQRRCATPLSHFRETGRLEATVGINAIDDR